MGGGQPDSDMKVDFAEIGIGKIGKIGISDYFSLKYRFLANFGKIGNKNFFGISYFSLKIRYSYRNILFEWVGLSNPYLLNYSKFANL